MLLFLLSLVWAILVRGTLHLIAPSPSELTDAVLGEVATSLIKRI